MIKIIINSDSNLDIGDTAISDIERVLQNRLGRFEDKLTRVVVHLKDENGQKTGGRSDKRCMLEARPESLNAINVTHDAPSVDESVKNACKKLERVLDDTFARLNDPRGK